MKPEYAAAQPTPASLGATPLMAPALPLCIFWPIVNSSNSIGTPTTIIAIKYATINLPPPCLKVRYGNFQIFPRPIEQPTAETTKVVLLYHLSLVVTMSPTGGPPAAGAVVFAAGASAAAGYSSFAILPNLYLLI